MPWRPSARKREESGGLQAAGMELRDAEESRQEVALLERRGGAWSIEFSPQVATVRHSRGMEYLARLLERPGEEIHVLELDTGPAGADVDDGERLERALGQVVRGIRTAIRRVAKVDPALGLHLERAVRTGEVCSYRGSAERPIEWSVEMGD